VNRGIRVGVSELLERVDRMGPRQRADFARVLIDRGSSFGVYPLSPAQRRMWFVEELYPGSAVHNVPYAFLLKGELDIDALRTSFDELIRRHEALRMSVFAIDGTPWQAVNEPWEGVLAIEPAHDGAEVWHAALAYAAEEASRPFELANSPLLRARLVRFPSECALLLVTAHHIVADGGWSMRVLFADFMRFYESLSATGQLPEVEAAPSFAALFQAHSEHTARRRPESLAYWTKQLAGAPTMLDLPTDHLRRTVARMVGDVAEAHWPGRLAHDLTEFAREQRVTPFAVLLAGFAALLHRYSGSDDLLIGTAASNRDGVHGVDAIGLFVNTVVLRSRTSESMSFRALVTDTMDTIGGAQRHQEFPFESLVEALNPERDTSHHPLIQVMCAIQNTHADGLRLGGVNAQAVPVHSASTKCDLGMTCALDRDAVRCWLEYDTDLFQPETAHRILEHTKRLLTAALAAPDRSVGTLPLCTDLELAQLVQAWGRGDREVMPGRLPHELFEEQADCAPEARAVSCGDTSLTYREVDDAANGLAHVLRAGGVGPDVRVGIYLPRGVDMAVAVLAVWKAGGAYVPLDVEHPPARSSTMLADSGAGLVITANSVADRLPATAQTVDVQAPAAVVRLPRIATGDNLAYVIYTSGSTGQPKGVATPYRAVVTVAVSLTRATGVTSADRMLQFASLGFDASVAEILLTLMQGGELVFAPREAIQPGPELEATIQDRGVTTALLSPTVLSMLRSDRVPSLTTLLVGSEMVPPKLAFEWSLSRRVLFVYGPTEATVISTASPCERLETLSPIGRPLLNEDVYVLDAKALPVPQGVRGELYIGGAALARGYLNQPSLTARQFVPDPFSGQPGARLYRTGDIVRFRPDGVLECFGRVDGQTKIRGIRIELGEISHQLGLLPDVQSCAVVARKFGPNDVRLVAYVMPTRPGPVDDRSLRDSLRVVLPEYMVPARFVAVREMPYTASGKLDYEALDKVGLPTDPVATVARMDAVEGAVADAWREVLEVVDVSVDDNFFDLGGNSLLISRVAALLRERMDRPVTALMLVRHPTIRSIAEHLGGGAGADREASSGDRRVAREGRMRTAAVRAERRNGRNGGSVGD